MRTIYKYELNATETPQKILLPEGSVARHVAVIDHVIYVWVEQPIGELVDQWEHTFIICGTGDLFEFPKGHMNYVGTVFQGPFVWHVYHSWVY